MTPSLILLIIIIATISLLIIRYWRFDVVAFMALVALLLTGIVPFKDAFLGLSNPVIITIASVMIISQSIADSGMIHYLLNKIEFLFVNQTIHIISLTTLAILLGATINDVGAMGILIPIAIQSAIRYNRSPSRLLMPIAFGSVIGGFLTAIGTVANLYVTTYREKVSGKEFNFFAFFPVGLTIAFFAVLFIGLIGWKLVPARRKASDVEEDFQISNYTVELKIPKTSLLANKTIKEMQELINADYQLIAVTQGGKKTFSFNKKTILHPGNILIIESGSQDDLNKIIQLGKLELASDKPFDKKTLLTKEITTIEAVVSPYSEVAGNSARMLRLKANYGINLLGLSRKSISHRQKLTDVRFAPGDVVLLQGNDETLRETIISLGFVPLAERTTTRGIGKIDFTPFACFVFAVLLSALNILPIHIAFSLAVLGIVLLKAIPIRKVYQSIHGPVIIFLAAMLPFGQAMTDTGAASMIAHWMTYLGTHAHPILALTLVLIISMTFSDFMNNAATAVIMTPIAVKLAQSLQVNPDTFLMAVGLGASCSFLMPFSHQSNLLVFGPGHFKVFDYLKLGILMELIIVLVGIPALLFFWPLHA